ncbi:tetratricopeptide repeat protein [Gloeobacter kilaueensis]|uniref:Tetratricopeptide repeat protein n=1 Tax=Gloeobacter kilaueensis (strain ATCC BAA-2537 / CCAP 1431/1 / ULC 316 / JS1) TaxID=1183438 RepID=U5QQK0_GLOK1|nr:tetratricopeptide repeat protein [Gloeobacter kilaueensis]AGY59889.1 tetratricopeptide repeat protein [Gloeobacter kilaueensis JS1]
MRRKFLSRFTPSLMAAEDLEAIFVQRQKLVERFTDLIRTSALTQAKHHTLLIGPRGIGKTHFVSLVYHRLKKQEELKEALRIAWLHEEEWGVSSLLDLLIRILQALVKEYNDQELEEKIESLYESSAAEAESRARKILKDWLGQRTLLLIVENLDDVFHGLKEQGQQKLRSYLQENPFCTILATSQSLFNGISLQTSPFYGFFRIQTLKGLSLEEVRELLIRLAQQDSNRDLETFLATEVALNRIKAIHHLAGGCHRIYIIFYQFLTRESLDELSSSFLETLDELTPYYQSRMASLSMQQRKIVEFLCTQGGGVTVKEIARKCFITHQTASSQLKDLSEKGYVQSMFEGRESFYEIREPLMRLCVEIKQSRGRPIRLFVEFLKNWYSRRELEELHSKFLNSGSIEITHLQMAIEEHDSSRNTLDLLGTLSKQIHHFREQWESFEQLDESKRAYCHVIVQLAKLMPQTPTSEDLEKFAPLLPYLEETATELVRWIEDDGLIWVFSSVARYYERQEAYHMAESWYRRCLQVCQERWGQEHPSVATSLNNLALLYLYQSSYKEAEPLFIQALEMNKKLLGQQHPSVARSFNNLGLLYNLQGQYEEAELMYVRALELRQKLLDQEYPYIALVLDNLAGLYRSQGRYEKAELLYTQALELRQKLLDQEHLDIARSLNNLAILYTMQSRWLEAFESYRKSFHILEKTGNKFREIGVLSHLIDACIGAEKWKETLKYIQLLLHEHAVHNYELPDDYWSYSLAGRMTTSLRALSAVKAEFRELKEWFELWKPLIERYSELQVPGRLLASWVQYQEKQGDPRVLLALPIEQRRILEELINPRPSTAGSETVH